MKGFVSVLVVLALISFPAKSETLIPNQDAFNALFNNDVALFNTENHPYKFTGIGVDYTVAANQTLRIEPGVEIHLAEDAQLIIEGLMENSEDDNDDDPIHFMQYLPGEPWRAIRLVGDNQLNNDIGEINLQRVTIEGGGANGDPLDPDNEGLIVMCGYSPDLTLGVEDGEDSLPYVILQDSETNGIVVINDVDEEDEFWDAQIRIYHADIGNSEKQVELTGIKMNDLNNDPDEGGLLNWCRLIIEDCSILNCGGHGIAVFYFDGIEAEITRTTLKSNGFGNGFNGDDGGAGVFFCNDENAYGVDGTIDIIDSEIESNKYDGARFDHMSLISTLIQTTVIESNWQRGIYYDFEGESNLLRIDNNEICCNGWDGIFTQINSMDANRGGVKIRGNLISGNGHETEVESPEDDICLANIRLHGPIGRASFGVEENLDTEIDNNIIKGANSGICLERLQNAARGPKYVKILNNIQSGAAFQGLRIQYIGIDGAFPEGEEPTIYNNVFYDNGSDDGGNDEESGIWIGPNCPSFVGHEDILQNNILAANYDYGIQYMREDNPSPTFHYNGFHQNGGASITDGCNSDIDIEAGVDDPVFVNASNDDFHLLWNCAMINRGNPGDDIFEESFDDAPYYIDPVLEEGSRDGSRNDIGAYGGPHAADYDFEPYCAINEDSDDLCNDNLYGNHTYLEWDYYRVFHSISTPAGEVLDIGDDEDVTGQAYFEFAGNYRWYVKGAIHANGDPGEGEDRNIVFCPMEGVERWMRLEINVPDGECWLRGCDMKSGGYNVYAYGGTVEDLPDLTISNCRFADSEYMNVYITGDIPVTIANSDFSGAQENGLKISNNENRSSVANCLITGNGSSATYYAGLYISSSIPSVITSTIGLNPNRGVYLFSSSATINGIGPELEEWANVIYNNGPDEQSGSTGAEFYLTSSSEPTISSTNIWDIREGERDGIFVYKIGDEADLFDQCYWGGSDSWPGQGIIDFDDEEDPEDFFVNADVPEDAETADEYITGADVPAVVADANDLNIALRLMSSNRYAEAVSYFWSYLRDAEARKPVSAIQRLLICVRRSENDLSELQEDYLTYASRRDISDLARFEARRYANLATLYSGDLESAIEDMRELLGDLDNLNDSIEVEMDIAYSELVASERGNNINAISDYEKRTRMLLERFENGINTPEKECPAIPIEFTLQPAFPNPFNGTTDISYQISGSGFVSLKITDIQGRTVENLFKGELPAGSYREVWNAGNAPAGLYFVNLNINGAVVSETITLIK
ncbi:right-handed parallel beta-helix repeat-containing protein [bacterium]|nr:right-handed parallel beta-helix repeat-containing protein [bacterium]